MWQRKRPLTTPDATALSLFATGRAEKLADETNYGDAVKLMDQGGPTPVDCSAGMSGSDGRNALGADAQQ